MLELSTAERICELLRSLYGAETASRAWQRLEHYPCRAAVKPLTERDNLLIAYGDQITDGQRPPLQVLAEFLERHTAGVVTGVHLLPHFPYSSDDGFSVIDYRQVNPVLGTWDDVRHLAGRFRLMMDAVINHVSARSAWFQGYQRGETPYTEYFIEADPSQDFSQVVRPRALPLLTPVQTSRGGRHVWTTFSDDQIDLNYRNPEVLLEILDILLLYVANGAQFLRLDAIAYLWKEPGTPCIHLPQTHRIVRLFRALLDLVAPGVMLVTETNVPHRDNLEYFGDGANEAHLVYNFALPPLTLHAFHTHNAATLSRWADGLTLPSDHVTFLNFLASHDGIGLNPVRGILTDAQIDALVERTGARGGLVSCKSNPDGTRSPYELNANFLDALDGNLDAFLTAQAIMLSLRGLPGIYFHSLFGSRGWPDGVNHTGRNRTINRQKLTRAQLEREMADPDSARCKIVQGHQALLKTRAGTPAFDPYAPQRVLDCGDAVFALLRTSRDGRQRVFCLHNVSAEHQEVRLDRPDGLLHDVTNGGVVATPEIQLQPYGTCWLAEEP